MLAGFAVSAGAGVLGQRLGLPAAVLWQSLVSAQAVLVVGLTLIARDPRLGFAGLVVAVLGFLGTVAVDAAPPGHGIVAAYRFDQDSLVALLVCVAAAAVTVVTARRPALLR
jgi:hypothetical protein